MNVFELLLGVLQFLWGVVGIFLTLPAEWKILIGLGVLVRILTSRRR